MAGRERERESCRQTGRHTEKLSEVQGYREIKKVNYAEQRRSRAWTITGSAWVKFISARAVASPADVNFKDSNNIY